MLRQPLTQLGGLALAVLVVGLALLTTSCGGGGGGYAAKDMTLVEFLFVDRSLVPTAPTGTANLPRNAQILLVFSELVNPDTVTDQTIQIRYGPTSQSVPVGSFSVDGNTVRFDPTVSAQGQPNPFGFEPVTQYVVDIPNFAEQPQVVENLDNDPNLETFFTTFVTSDGFLRELDPPEVLRVYSIPDRFDVNPLTGQWPGNGLLAIEFNEPMDPGSFILGGPSGPDEMTTVDIRYSPFAPANQGNPDVIDPVTGLGRRIPGSFTHDPGATTYFFKPTFSFGAGKYVFTVEVFQGLRDLSGNLLINPRSFGPYQVDGNGIGNGEVLEEDFINNVDQDIVNIPSEDRPDWGGTEEGVLQGQPVTTRAIGIFGFLFQGTGPNNFGQYAAIISPMIGQALNQYLSNINPPTNQGRRAQWAFRDDEIGENGSITAAGWGPDSNATFAAIYPDIVLRFGYQKQNSLSLSPSFAGNYAGNPTVVYKGSYSVPQAANVGNTVDSGGDPGGYNQNPGCARPAQAPVCPVSGALWNCTLWDFTGFQSWPNFTTFFEWSRGDPSVVGDRVLLFDASCDEGDTWQQLRGWFGASYPCSGILIGGFPNRRMYGTYEDDEPKPPSNFALGILNPEPSMTDTAFAITKRISIAQTKFYTDGLQPPGSNSLAKTFGSDSDYLPIEISPSVQSGGAQIRIEFQACQAVLPGRVQIDEREPFLPAWTSNVNDCDGYACVRWRITLISNLISGTPARLVNVRLPVIDSNPDNP